MATMSINLDANERALILKLLHSREDALVTKLNKVKSLEAALNELAAIQDLICKIYS